MYRIATTLTLVSTLAACAGVDRPLSPYDDPPYNMTPEEGCLQLERSVGLSREECGKLSVAEIAHLMRRNANGLENDADFSSERD
ncbi:hypothetical protein [Roseobacter sp. HKCCA0434]|uniref:hypothetical protein n=1 Tax=Roseobacter sp. HKCCA0434 TaxID=3079297 RepID=UPI0029059622|nr:hypothetical protein [Roseobacter sp. HKCCA0434]